MVLDEGEKIRLERDSRFFRRFSSIKAPNLDPEELEKLSQRLYTSPDLAAEEIQDLFTHMKPVLAKTAIPPDEIMDTIQDTLLTRELGWRRKVPPAQVQPIESAEERLSAARRIKEQLLQKIWRQRRENRQPLPLLIALSILERVLIPSYERAVVDLKSRIPALASQNELLINVQKQFNRFFGQCTEAEELRLKALSARLAGTIKGQDRALTAICNAIHCWRKVPPLDGKPLVLFFAGPSAVGKTRTSTEVAYQLNAVYGIADADAATEETNVLRISLNREDQGGFLGWDKVNRDILAHIIRTPISVVALEEWDKGSEEDMSSLLELLDSTQNHFQRQWWDSSGANGKFVDKRCVIFILTSNIAAKELSTPEPSTLQKDVETVKSGIRDHFPEAKRVANAPAFLSRVDAFIPFRGIAQPAVETIIDNSLADRRSQKILPDLKYDSVRQRIMRDIGPNMDIRELQRIIQNAIYEETKI